MMGDEREILVVEDDPAVRNLVATALDVRGYRHREATTGAAALVELTSSPDVSLVILDLGLPDRDGVEVIRALRGWSRMPVIVLSARQEDADKVEALDAGADDYLTKPFSVDELLARVRVALRRLDYAAPAQAAVPDVYRNGGLGIDFDAGVVTRDGAEVHLTPIEYKLLCLLARNTGKVLTHNYILKEVWGQALAADLPSLRVFMATLRKKIEPDPANPRYLQTHVGIGYRMLNVE
ncbi:response regulator [Adlercreutzia faecimuris]|uniref:Response regulator transcription factor n=1 Tax=Adlercreutzia faecimuris TaxID=2897341 RepID=A0ABS9WEL0_9ACTN|nr:response regulator transcription factor [Adlercreutzia sp. JBNU-10]MCI2241301.1 response regulator transcription factor [Adlercreutzia sp. JBNU-10]